MRAQQNRIWTGVGNVEQSRRYAHPLGWTQDASRKVKFAFRLRRATKNAFRQVKICLSPTRNTKADLGRTVFPAQGQTIRVSGSQNLRFACAGPQKNACREVTMCVSPARNTKNAFPEVSGGQTLLFDYPARVSSKRAMYEFTTRVSSKSVPQECPVRVSCKSVKKECHVRASYKSVK